MKKNKTKKRKLSLIDQWLLEMADHPNALRTFNEFLIANGIATLGYAFSHMDVGAPVIIAFARQYQVEFLPGTVNAQDKKFVLQSMERVLQRCELTFVIQTPVQVKEVPVISLDGIGDDEWGKLRKVM